MCDSLRPVRSPSSLFSTPRRKSEELSIPFMSTPDSPQRTERTASRSAVAGSAAWRSSTRPSMPACPTSGRTTASSPYKMTSASPSSRAMRAASTVSLSAFATHTTVRGMAFTLSISSEKCCSMKRLLWKKAGIREKECSLRTAFRPPPCVPSPTVQNDSGDGAWTKTFFVIYCFY